MSNKIDPVDQGMHGRIGDKIGEATSARKVGVNSPTTDKKADKQVAVSDTVQLTQSAKLLERIDKTLAELPAVDPARIEAVRADIASGNYAINAEKIADALLKTDLELGK